MIEVVAAGALTTFQDLGRPGLAALGVSPSGAADRGSLMLANRVVGNAENMAALEVTMGGLELWFQTAGVVAITGAPAIARVNRRVVGLGAPVAVGRDDVVRIEPPSRGARSYVAVAGGYAVEPVLGSCATDTLGGIGPRALAAGDRIGLARRPLVHTVVDVAPQRDWEREWQSEALLSILPGPRVDWFAAEAIDELCTATYTVDADSNRIAIRLDGPSPQRTKPGELLPEGVLFGSIQVPPSGQMVVFGPDHPVTGGYPVIAVVTRRDLSRVGQLRPGDRVRFRRVRHG